MIQKMEMIANIWNRRRADNHIFCKIIQETAEMKQENLIFKQKSVSGKMSKDEHVSKKENEGWPCIRESLSEFNCQSQGTSNIPFH